MSELRHVQGLDQVIANMRHIVSEKGIKGHMRKAVLAGSYVVRDAARAKAPVWTGRLQAAIITKYIPEQSKAGTVTYFVLAKSGKKFSQQSFMQRGFDMTNWRATKTKVVGLDAFYWRFVEFGTYKMPAQPFLRPAFDENRDRALGMITLYLKQGFDQSVRAFGKSRVLDYMR